MPRFMPAKRLAERLDGLLEGDPDVDRWSTYVGRGAIRFYLPLNVRITKRLLYSSRRRRQRRSGARTASKKLEAALAENFPSAVTRVSPLGLGPPVGWPVQYRVSGPDVSEVRDIALRLAQIVATDPGSRHVNFDWMEPARMVRIRIDQDQARLLGLSSQAIASVMNTRRDGHARHASPGWHLPGRCPDAGDRRSSVCRFRHCALCRFRFRTAARFRSAKSRASISLRNIR